MIFDQGVYEYDGNQYCFNSFKPAQCVFCSERDIYKHGCYERNISTFLKGNLTTVDLRNRRWYCLYCGHTMSVTPPNLIKRHKACSLAVFLLLWIYLNTPEGYEKCNYSGLEEIAERGKVFRYLKRARKNDINTLQAIREVVLENTAPEVWENITLSGLSPPEYVPLKPTAGKLWEASTILTRGSELIHTPISVLLTRAQERSKDLKKQFLIDIQ